MYNGTMEIYFLALFDYGVRSPTLDIVQLCDDN